MRYMMVDPGHHGEEIEADTLEDAIRQLENWPVDMDGISGWYHLYDETGDKGFHAFLYEQDDEEEYP